MRIQYAKHMQIFDYIRTRNTANPWTELGTKICQHVELTLFIYCKLTNFISYNAESRRCAEKIDQVSHSAAHSAIYPPTEVPTVFAIDVSAANQ